MKILVRKRSKAEVFIIESLRFCDESMHANLSSKPRAQEILKTGPLRPIGVLGRYRILVWLEN